MLAHERKRADWIAAEEVDLSFLSDRWQKLLKDSEDGQDRVNRRQLGVCVFSYLAAELKSGDISIAGAGDVEEHGSSWSSLQ